MQTRPLFGSALAVALASIFAAACDPVTSPISGDAYNGVFDSGALDAKFVPVASKVTCHGSSACYSPQTGFANGAKVFFYNAGALPTPLLPGTKTPAPLTPALASHNSDGSGGIGADVFPNSCSPGPVFNPQADAFPTNRQSPVLDSLPLATSAFGAIVWPLVSIYGVTGVQGEQCNDIKSHDSIASAGASAAGEYGARRTTAPNSYEVWLLLDPALNVFGTAGQLLNGLNSTIPFAWYRGLQVPYVAGPRIPTDASGNFLVQEGVILDPVGSGFEKTITSLAILLPYGPADDGFSPIIRLHDYSLPTGKKLGDFKSVCPVGAPRPCAADSVDMTSSSVGNAFNTLFIVPSAQ